jgi:hypothetical protein
MRRPIAETEQALRLSDPSRFAGRRCSVEAYERRASGGAFAFGRPLRDQRDDARSARVGHRPRLSARAFQRSRLARIRQARSCSFRFFAFKRLISDSR